MESNMSKYLSSLTTLERQIEDYDLNDLSFFSNKEDFDSELSKVEKIRLQYFETYEELSEDIKNDNLSRLNLFREKVKSHRKSILQARMTFLNDKSSSGVCESKFSTSLNNNEMVCKFYFDECSELLRVIGKIFKENSSPFTNYSDADILSLKEIKTELSNYINLLTSNFDKLVSAGGGDKGTFDSLHEKVMNMKQIKYEWDIELSSQIKSRELNKNVDNSGILQPLALKKFSGSYDDQDIYSFKQVFDKSFGRKLSLKDQAYYIKCNLLESEPLRKVEHLDDINEIWKILISKYGGGQKLFRQKINCLVKYSTVSGSYVNQLKYIEELLKFMVTLEKLVDDFMEDDPELQYELYSKDLIDKIISKLGHSLSLQWFRKYATQKSSGSKSRFKFMKDFLQNQIAVLELQIDCLPLDKDKNSSGKEFASSRNKVNMTQNSNADYEKSNGASNNWKCPNCFVCNDKHSAYTCPTFLNLSNDERMKAAKSKNVCFKCMKHSYDRKNPCKSNSYWCCILCQNQKQSVHFLLCNHVDHIEKNKKRIPHFLEKNPEVDKQFSIHFSQANLQIHSANASSSNNEDGLNSSIITDNQEYSIYLYQLIPFYGSTALVFYDSGCSGCTILGSLAQEKNLKEKSKGPITLSVAGGNSHITPYGEFEFQIPDFKNRIHNLSGIGLDIITPPVPIFRLESVFKEMRLEKIPYDGILPPYVGGQPVSIMIGIRYGYLMPKLLYRDPSGLTIYESQVQDVFGSRMIIAGPHKNFTDTINTYFGNNFNVSNTNDHMFHLSYNVYKEFIQNKELNYPTSIVQTNKCGKNCLSDEASLKRFLVSENIGIDVSYRCVNCRSCPKCKSFQKIETGSIKEEFEQELIEKSVCIDLKLKQSIASLPFCKDPDVYLSSNMWQADKVLNAQLKLSQAQRNDIVKFHDKLVSAGYSTRLVDQPLDLQNMINNSKVNIFLPWRAVWKSDSVSTPCRMVFDGTMCKLNEILAKGINSLNSLQEILINFRCNPYAYTFDIKKMYNAIKLRPEHWRFQLYLWVDNLDVNAPIEIRIITTLIYGMKPSGGQSEFALREVAKQNVALYPNACKVILKNTYVDDGISGSYSIDHCKIISHDITKVLDSGGFQVKGFAFSYEKPDEMMSEDGHNVMVAGMKWETEKDVIRLKSFDLNFNKKKRGCKTINDGSIVPNLEDIKNFMISPITRRHITSKVAEIFDLIGLFTPITVGLKLDLHELVEKGLDWDDVIPNDIKSLWYKNFQTICKLKEMPVRRAIVPINAENPYEMESYEFCDASEKAACCAIYGRYKLQNGSYYCQLLFSRSKLTGETVPRNELTAATLLVYSSKIVESALYDIVKTKTMFTDSEITLHWIQNESKRNNLFVRNRVIEINRLSNKSNWLFVDGKNNPADYGTRRGRKLTDVDITSIWHLGYPWMCNDINESPTKSYSEIRVKDDTKVIDESESYSKNIFNYISEYFNYPCKQLCNGKNEHNFNVQIKGELIDMKDRIKERYYCHGEQSYLIDPIKFGWNFSIKVIAICLKFVYMLRHKVDVSKQKLIDKKSKDSSEISDSTPKIAPIIICSDFEIKRAYDYFYKKATKEVKYFCTEKQKADTKEVDNILYHTGRILDGTKIEIISENASKFDDSYQLKFVKPVIDRWSPVAYSLGIHIHWNLTPHRGVTTMYRKSIETVFIINGRELFKEIRKSCKRCRYLLKRTLEVEMGSINKYQLIIAPAFYSCMIDLCGPFIAHSAHNMRSTIKIWFCVFVCITTGAVRINTMEKYDTPSFIYAFERFSSYVAYPQYLLIDPGSQLVKGCNDMKLNFSDLKAQLYLNKKCIVEQCPVQAHWVQGKVERRIRIIRESIERMPNVKQSVLSWETTASVIANSMNNQPLAIGNTFSGLGNLDIITPNRLLKGRNDSRCPLGPIVIENNPTKMLESKTEQFNAWFDIWLEYIPKLMLRPKWHKNDNPPCIGDVILFNKGDSQLKGIYQYGIIQDLIYSKDGKIRSIQVKYKNHNENIDRISTRSVRDVIIIAKIDEVDFYEELHKIAVEIDHKYQNDIKSWNIQ